MSENHLSTMNSSDSLPQFVERETARMEEFASQQLKRLRMAYPGQRWDGDEGLRRIDFYDCEIIAMVAQFGFARTEAAVTAAIRGGTSDGDGRRNLSFMPTVAELRALVPAEPRITGKVPDEMRELQRRKDAGEEFFCLADVARAMKAKLPGIDPAKVLAHTER